MVLMLVLFKVKSLWYGLVTHLKVAMPFSVLCSPQVIKEKVFETIL